MKFDHQARRVFHGAAGREDALRWLERIHADWRDVERAFSRNLTLLVAAGIGFLLVAGGNATEFSLAGLKVADMSLAALTLAVLFSYLYSSLVGLVAESFLQLGAFSALSKITDPDAYAEDLEIVLYPPNSFLLTSMKLALFQSGTTTLMAVTWWLKILLLATTPLLAAAYMFQRLLDDGHLPPGLVFASATVAIVLALSNWPILVATLSLFELSDKAMHKAALQAAAPPPADAGDSGGSGASAPS